MTGSDHTENLMKALDELLKTQPADPDVTANARALANALQASTLAEPTDVAPGGGAIDDSPDRVGPYQILEEVGEGGMGTVYVAEQREPIQRRVALKVIKLGMDTREVLARFEAERQALAVMDHPCIAKVYEAGATPEGRPYFAMEHIKGDTLTEYCDRNRLTTKERLGLFMQICQGVQHAHQKGVIHRDLKPANILVTLQDGKPVPKIIDFGVAKATAQRLTEHTVYTERGQIIGTPEYMSPEQAEMTGVDIDTRTDVYSLGVILYEMLVGALPFDPTSLRAAGYAEIQRIIREVDPPKPSTRLSSLGDDSTTSATNRRADTRTLVRRMRGDLDWITMKALEKDRTRRYESPAQFAEDIGRHLKHEPVVAGPPSTAYRMRKFVRKNRGFVAATVIVVLALVGGVVGTYSQYLDSENARSEAVANLELATAEKERADGAANAAEQARAEEARRAEELDLVADFQAEQLSGIDVSTMGVRLRRGVLERARAAYQRAKLSDEEADERAHQLEKLLAGTDLAGLALSALEENVFDRALAAIDEQFVEQPAVQAHLYQTLAITFTNLGLLRRAEKPQSQALEIRKQILGKENPETLDSLNAMGCLLVAQGQLEEGEALVRDALETSKEVLGEDHRLTLNAIMNLGYVLLEQGGVQEARPYFEEALEQSRLILGNEDPDTLVCIGNMAWLIDATGDSSGAEPYYQEALERSRRVHGEDHPATLRCMNNLALNLQQMGRLDESEPLLREALDKLRRTLGDDHPQTLASIINMGLLLNSRGQLQAAEAYCNEAIEGHRRVHGPDHHETLLAINNLGMTFAHQGRYAEADELLSEVLSRKKRTLGETHADTLLALNNMAFLRNRQGRPVEAEPFAREGLLGYEATVGRDHPHALSTRANLAFCLEGQGRLAEAELVYRELVDSYNQQLGEENPRTLSHAHHLAEFLAKHGKTAESERLHRAVLARRRHALGEDHRQTLSSLVRLGAILRELGKLEEAEELEAEAVDLGKNTLGPREQVVGTYLAGHGLTLLELKRFADCAPQLEEAYSILSATRGDEHEETQRVLADLVRCYEAWHEANPEAGHDSKTSEWRAKLEAAQSESGDE